MILSTELLRAERKIHVLFICIFKGTATFTPLFANIDTLREARPDFESIIVVESTCMYTLTSHGEIQAMYEIRYPICTRGETNFSFFIYPT